MINRERRDNFGRDIYIYQSHAESLRDCLVVHTALFWLPISNHILFFGRCSDGRGAKSMQLLALARSGSSPNIFLICSTSVERRHGIFW